MISRTLAHAIITGMLIGVYAGLVLLATQVPGLHSTVAAAAAMLAAAALGERNRVAGREERGSRCRTQCRRDLWVLGVSQSAPSRAIM